MRGAELIFDACVRGSPPYGELIAGPFFSELGGCHLGGLKHTKTVESEYGLIDVN